MTDADLDAIPAARLPDLLRRMPKAELHLHVEGTLEPELAFALAERNRVRLPWRDVASLRAAYAFTSLQSFLDVYYSVASVLRTEADFHDLAWSYLDRAAEDSVRRAEIFFDPLTHTSRGVPVAHVIEGLHHACERARAELGVSASLVLCFLRHRTEAEAFATLESALPHRRRFIGIGLDSSEFGHPPRDFARVFALGRELGLHVVAHAGEEGPPEYVTEALDLLHAERIDHGVRAMEDPELVRRLARDRVPLTVCPLSNVCLRVVETTAEHPLRALLEAGVLATVNSDDPAYFGGYLAENLRQSFEALGLGARHARTLARNGFEASFADEADRRHWLGEVDAFFEREAGGAAG
ncbi:MAG: adenosine deaminase [Alphaproteobacteria bacterium]